MKTHLWINISIIFILLPLFAAGQDHSHPHNDTPAQNQKMTPHGQFTVYAESQQYELTLRHGRINPRKEAELTLYIADYQSNAPVSDATIEIALQSDPSVEFDVELHEPGIYHINGAFQELRDEALTVSLNSPTLGVDLLLLHPVEVGKSPPIEEAAAHVEHVPPKNQWWKYLLVLLGGILLGWILFRRQPKVAALLFVALSIPVVIEDASAHGGHGDEKEATAGNSVFIPKETQFLFDLITQPVKPGDFQPAVQLYGTVVPTPAGFAEIASPQNGRITSLNISPGMQVRAGQTLATLSVSASQADQVTVATETGRLQVDIEAAIVERDAAERDLDRLRAIADIAAKKDVQAAEARYNRAVANLTSLRSVSEGPVSRAGSSLVLKSPITGTIGQFTLAPGSEIQAGTTLFSVTSLEKVYIEAQVYDKDSEIVQNAGKYSVTCSNDAHEAAQVRLVSAAMEVNPTNQSQKVLFELENPEGEFKIGEFVTLQAFQRMSSRTIFVPNSTLSEINGRSVVFVKEGPESYHIRYISPGEDNGTHTVVQKGLQEDERIVLSGTYQVKMMMLNQ